MTGTILLVEDGPATHTMVKTVLEAEGFHVDGVRSGRDAIAALDQRSFDGMLLDLMLPEVEGLDVIRSIRARRLMVPIIVMTGEQTLASEAIKEGAQACLIKPFTFENLRDEVSRWFLGGAR
ncbi:response regulator [Candidatus Nitrospira bockiana]